MPGWARGVVTRPSYRWPMYVSGLRAAGVVDLGAHQRTIPIASRSRRRRSSPTTRWTSDPGRLIDKDAHDVYRAADRHPYRSSRRATCRAAATSWPDRPRPWRWSTSTSCSPVRRRSGRSWPAVPSSSSSMACASRWAACRTAAALALPCRSEALLVASVVVGTPDLLALALLQPHMPADRGVGIEGRSSHLDTERYRARGRKLPVRTVAPNQSDSTKRP